MICNANARKVFLFLKSASAVSKAYLQNFLQNLRGEGGYQPINPAINAVKVMTAVAIAIRVRNCRFEQSAQTIEGTIIWKYHCTRHLPWDLGSRDLGLATSIASQSRNRMK